MKLIVGLGNPGREYEHTRHNVGWWVVDHLADVWRPGAFRRDGQALVASGRIGGTPVRLLKPLTFMNLSGSVLAQYLRRPAFAPASDLLVIVDDVALPVGRLRLRARGSAGGHNGLKSVEHAIGSREYPRLRIGIQPALAEGDAGDLADFVLAPFARTERDEIRSLLPRCREVVERWLHDGIEAAMGECNRDSGLGTRDS